MEKLKNNILIKVDVVHRQMLMRWVEIQENKKMWDETKKKLEPIYT